MHPSFAPYRFQAFEISYFSAKVRPALCYKKLWYEELRADLPELMRRTGMAFIPVVVTTMVYSLWMVQRAMDAYAALERPERVRADRALAGSGWPELLAYPLRHRLVKKGFALALA